MFRLTKTVGAGQFTLIVVFVLLNANAYAAIEDRPWFNYKSAHFDVYSDDDQEDVIAQIMELEYFRAVVLKMLGDQRSPDISPHPTKTIMFRRSSDMRRIFKAGKLFGEMRGIFRLGSRFNYLVIPGDGRFDKTDVLYHEYFLYLSRGTTSFPHPLWYEAGLGEVLSTVKTEEGHVVVGEVPVTRSWALSFKKPLKLSSVLHTKSLSEKNSFNALRFYARAWLFVHFLNFSVNSKLLDFPQKLEDLLIRTRQGESYETLFPELFGMSIKEMDRVLYRYVNGRSLRFRYPIELLYVNDSIEQQRMSREEVLMLLADVSLKHNPNRAGKMWRKLLKNEPNNGRALAGIAASYRLRGQPERGFDVLDQALLLAPDEYRVHLEQGYALIDQCQANKTRSCHSLSTVNQAVSHFREAHALAPYVLETNVAYGEVLFRAGRYLDALALNQAAVARQPSDPRLNGVLGQNLLLLGQTEEARSYLERAQLWSAYLLDPDEWLLEEFKALKSAEDGVTGR